MSEEKFIYFDYQKVIPRDLGQELLDGYNNMTPIILKDLNEKLIDDSKREIATDLTEYEKDLFSKVGIKYKDEVMEYRLARKINNYPVIERFKRKSKVPIYGMLDLLMSNELLDKEFKFVKELFTRYVGCCDYVICEEIIQNRMENYINFIIFNLQMGLWTKLIDLLFKIKSLDLFPDLLQTLKNIIKSNSDDRFEKEIRERCLLSAIKYDVNIKEFFDLSKTADIEHIQLAIKHNRDEQLIKYLIENFCTIEIEGTTVSEKWYVVLSYSIIYNMPTVRDVLIKIFTELQPSIDWLYLFRITIDMITDSEIFKVTDGNFLNINMFNYLFGKVKLFFSKENTIEEDLENTNEIYIHIWKLRDEFLKFPIKISKSFIDQYKLEKFQVFHDYFYIQEGDLDTTDEYLTGFLNKESFLYYLLIFPENSIPNNYLLPTDILYLVNVGFPKEKLINVNLKPANAIDFLNVYDKVKTASLHDSSEFLVPVINKIVGDYI